MPTASESVTDYISKLAGSDAQEREIAAYALFRLGCASAEPVLREWLADREFRAIARGGKALLTIGLAVQPSTFEEIRARFGQPPLADVPADQDVLEFELGFAHGVRLDVITPRTSGAEGAIAKFLSRFGEGIQQIECDVQDVARATEILRQRFGVEPVYREVREGANHTLVNFFLVGVPPPQRAQQPGASRNPAENRKLLIELVQAPKKPKRL